ncbi:MAG: hypothetical protein MJZ28_05095 [Paludibacteraceae bacterium]|nr:hypothetical protein [Paludibacteraceae bacterium]
MLTIFLLTLALVGVGMLFLCVRILFVKGGRFSSKHVGQSRELRQKGVYCVQTQDRMEQARAYQDREAKL